MLDLADPKWKGKLDIAPSETDFQPIVTSVTADIGDAATVTWLRALKANAGRHQDPDNETLVANVNKGIDPARRDQPLLLVPAARRGGSERHALGAGLLSRRTTTATCSTCPAPAVLKSSKHQQAAQALVAFLVSKPGQTVLASGDSWEYPIGSGVTNPKLPPLSSLQPKAFDLDPDR